MWYVEILHEDNLISSFTCCFDLKHFSHHLVFHELSFVLVFSPFPSSEVFLFLGEWRHMVLLIWAAFYELIFKVTQDKMFDGQPNPTQGLLMDLVIRQHRSWNNDVKVIPSFYELHLSGPKTGGYVGTRASNLHCC